MKPWENMSYAAEMTGLTNWYYTMEDDSVVVSAFRELGKVVTCLGHRQHEFGRDEGRELTFGAWAL